MIKKRRRYTPSKSSPKGGKRGCLCEDNTYSSKCCDGSLQAQGIGSITMGEVDSAGTIIRQDTTTSSSSTSTTEASQGSSTVIHRDTTNTINNSSSTKVISMKITEGTYSVSDPLPLVATFNSPVNVDTTEGTPTVDVNIDENTREFSYTEGSGTEDLTFEYTLVEEDADFQNVEVATDIELNGGTITDEGGDSIETTTESIVVTTENVTPPSVTITTPEVIPDANTSNLYRGVKSVRNAENDILIEPFDFWTTTQINTYHNTTYEQGIFWTFYADTESLEVGSFLYEANGYIYDDNNTQQTGTTNYTAWEDLSDENYIPLQANLGDFIVGGNWNLYPVYKFEKIDGYLRCTQIITSPPL